MDTLAQVQTVLLLMIVVLVLATIANRIVLPYPILLVLGGLALSFVPGAPIIPLDPDLVFLIFLPPILWAAAYFTSLNPGGSRAEAEAQAAFRRLRHETLNAERRAVIELRDRGLVSDEVLHRIEQELDVEATRIGLGELRI